MTPMRYLRCAALWSASFACLLAALTACSPSSAPPEVLRPDAWHEFSGTWTATGTRREIPLGGDRHASVGSFAGTLLLAGPGRPGVGFRAEALVFNDTATGIIGRSVWTDERGDQLYSQMKGQGTEKGNRIEGTFMGGTGRYAGATGNYEFSWQFVLESDDGQVQGQSQGFKGRGARRRARGRAAHERPCARRCAAARSP